MISCLSAINGAVAADQRLVLKVPHLPSSSRDTKHPEVIKHVPRDESDLQQIQLCNLEDCQWGCVFLQFYRSNLSTPIVPLSIHRFSSIQSFFRARIESGGATRMMANHQDDIRCSSGSICTQCYLGPIPCCFWSQIKMRLANQPGGRPRATARYPPLTGNPIYPVASVAGVVQDHGYYVGFSKPSDRGDRVE